MNEHKHNSHFRSSSQTKHTQENTNINWIVVHRSFIFYRNNKNDRIFYSSAKKTSESLTVKITTVLKH